MLKSSSYYTKIVLPLNFEVRIFRLPPTISRRKKKKDVNEKEAKKVGRVREPEKRVFFLMDNLCHSLIEQRGVRERRISNKKRSQIQFTLLACSLVDDVYVEKIDFRVISIDDVTFDFK